MKAEEEKAKAYDEAIAKAQKELQVCGSTDCDAARQIIRLFPELAESEDEKVKRIIHSISNKISFHLHDIFTEEEFQCFDAWSNAWLEKQGDKDKLIKELGKYKVKYTQEVLSQQLEKTMNNEDKKIREALIKFHKSTINIDGIKGKDILAWLENQPIISPEEMRDLLSMDYSKGRYDTITKTVEWLSGYDEWGLQHITPEELVEDFKKYIEGE